MLPGKANKEPVPSIFLTREVKNALATAYQGPSITADSILIACCIGKHFATPTGIKRMWAVNVPMAISRADKVSFFVSMNIRLSM
jgi:hypothetical protein